MKNNSKARFTLLTLVAVLSACGGTSSSSNNPTSLENSNTSFSSFSSQEKEDKTSVSSTSIIKDSSSSSSKDNSTSTSTSTSTQTTTSNSIVNNKKITLRMFGSLYLHQIRTIYASKTNMDDELIWSSSDDTIVKTSIREGLDTECNLIALKEGEVTITAASKEDNSVKATMKIKVQVGTKMPSELFNSITKGLEVNSAVKYLQYDEDYDPSIDSEDDILTIYEETEPLSTAVPNYTDAYEINVKNHATGVSSFHKKYVRGSSGYVSVETVDHKNNVTSKKVINDDYPEGIKFNNSYYINFFASEDTLTNENFETFDGGKTYFYTGTMIGATYLCASLFMTDMSPDQMYFKVENNEIKSFNIDIDPVNKDVTSKVKYGLNATCTFSKHGEAKIDHMKPYSHASVHDALDAAKDVFKTCKNYKVKYNVKYNATSEDQTFTYTFKEDAIDIVLEEGGKITSHEGIYKYKEGYIEYTYNDSTKELKINKTHDQAWNAVNRYPTFDFASELFDFSNNKYVLDDTKNNNFIKTCMYLSTLLGESSFYNSELTLKDGKINTIASSFDYQGIAFGRLTAEYSEYNTASIDIDFTELDEDDKPKTFKEANPILFKEMGYWGLQDVMPYLYSSAGWDNTVYFLRTDDRKGVEHTFIKTKAFASAEDTTAFLNAYKEMLLNSGYTYSDTNLVNGLPSYTKGEYSFSLDYDRYYDRSPKNVVTIYIKSANFTLDMYYASMED